MSMGSLASNLSRAAFAGSVADLMQERLGAFEQPWYSPVPTTPENTGMAFGGLGGGYTMNLCGKTASLNFVNTEYVLQGADEGFELWDLFLAERAVDAPEFEIVDARALRNVDFFHPLVRPDGQRWLRPNLADSELRATLDAMLSCDTLTLDNRAKIDRWQKTPAMGWEDLLSAPDVRSQNLRLLRAFYADALSLPASFSCSLLAGSGTRHGQPCVARERVTVSALFPAMLHRYAPAGARCTYERLTFSPVSRSSEEVTALPVTVSRFIIKNPSAQRREVTLIWLLENANGYRSVKWRPGSQDGTYRLLRTPKHQRNADHPLRHDGRAVELAASDSSDGLSGRVLGALRLLGTGRRFATCRSELYTAAAAETVREALSAGSLSPTRRGPTKSSSDGLSAALCATLDLGPGEEACVELTLVTDFPRVEFEGRTAESRRYTAFFRMEDRAARILERAITDASGLEAASSEFQTAVIECLDAQLGSCSELTRRRFASVALNQVSVMSDLATWTVEGGFRLKECLDYPFYNSLDVYFYGSFALNFLLPAQDARNVEEFLAATRAENPTQRRFWLYAEAPHAERAAGAYEGMRKRAARVPHDLGSPFDPHCNAYFFHDSAQWKDLPPKLALLTYRRYETTRDRSELSRAYPTLKEALDAAWDEAANRCALPVARGVSNTYDNLATHGVNIYDSQLWLAGLRVMTRIALALDRREEADQFESAFERGRRTLSSLLWDGEFGAYSYSTAPIEECHLRPEALARLTEALDRVGLAVGQRDVVARLNEIVYGDSPELRKFDAGHGDGPLGKCARATRRKQALRTLSPACFGDAFVESWAGDSDDLFTDQLIGDYYLLKLGLPAITPIDQRRSALARIYEVSFLKGAPAVGPPNLVRRDGRPQPAFQGQDVWFGVVFTVLELLRLHGMYAEFEHLFNQLFEVTNVEAHLPFGIPEGMNCTYADPERASASSVERLLALSAEHYRRLHRREPPSWPDFLRTPRFTAGRYSRSGSIFASLFDAEARQRSGDTSR